MPPKPKKNPPNPYPTISDEFGRRYENPNGEGVDSSNQNSQGIQNARTSRYFSDEKYLKKGERGRKALARRNALAYAPGEKTEQSRPNNYQSNQVTTNRGGLIKGSIKQNLGRIRSVPIGASTLIWSVPYYFTIHLPLAIFSSIALGFAWYLGNLEAEGISLLAPLFEGTGLAFDSFLILYFGLTLVLIVFNAIELIIAMLMFKLAFLHPLMGARGGFSKITFAFLTIFACIIPGLNMFPFFFLWLLFAVLNPK